MKADRTIGLNRKGPKRTDNSPEYWAKLRKQFETCQYHNAGAYAGRLPKSVPLEEVHEIPSVVNPTEIARFALDAGGDVILCQKDGSD